MMTQVIGGSGNDKIFGPDYVVGNSDGMAVLSGQDGDDLLDLGDFNHINVAYGGAGNDKIIGGQHYGSQNL